jgi:pimeloyl-ACP methyl ester carboxylesterase
MAVSAPVIEGAVARTLAVGALSFTAYEMGEGPVVLCLHGFPDTPRTWRRLLPELARNGWRAVAVTARGYEPSSQPADGDYGVAALSDDVCGWMDALGAEKAHVVGHDWGASIAYAASARSPERVLSLTTLAVPHPAGFAAALANDLGQLKRSWYVFLFQVLGLSDLLVEANDWAFIEMLWRDWSPGWAFDLDDMAAVKQTLAKPGVKTAALGYYRAAFDAAAPRREEAQRLATLPIEVPTLGLAGASDGCISAEVFQAAMPAALFPAGLRTDVIAGAGHFLQLERPALVNEAIQSWLMARR